MTEGVTRSPTQAAAPDFAGVPRQVAWRLLPLLGLIYVIAQIDRVNVSFAALTMNADLGFSDAVYGFGAGLFFLGYLVFQVPSNLLLERYGAGRVLAVLMMAWGVASAATALVRTPAEFYLIRTLLGVAESGVYPGIMLYLTYWFRAQERATAIGLFTLSVPVAGLVGSPLSGFILERTDGGLGIAGWQWLFVLEGLPAAGLALVVLLVLAERPRQARWLDAAASDWLEQELASEPAARRVGGWTGALRQRRVWWLAAAYFLFAGGLIGSLYWLPKLVRAVAPGLAGDTIGWMIGLPYLAFGVASVLWARHSDRRRERRWHFASGAWVGAAGLLALGLARDALQAQLALVLMMFGMGMAFSTFWGLVTGALDRHSAAVGIALINACGSLASFCTIYGVGLVLDAGGGYLGGFGLLALMVAASTPLALAAREGAAVTR